MNTELHPDLFHIYEESGTTVMGFSGRYLSDSNTADQIQDRLLSMLSKHECDVLVVDLLDVGIVSSWVLGMLAAVKQRGVDVQLYHLSKEIREVLDVTSLNRLLHVRETMV